MNQPLAQVAFSALALAGATVLAALPTESGDSRPMQPFLIHPRDGVSNVMAKLASGEKVVVGYLGASVTNGAGASNSNETSWRGLTFRWLAEQFPDAELQQIHRVSGGTGAQLGAARAGREYLASDPDLMFVEFAVNDGGKPYQLCVDTMEGIVRQIRRHDRETDIIFVYAINQGSLKEYQAGRLPRTVEAHEAVAEHYGIATVNMGWRAAQDLIAGRMTWDEFSIDSVHPTDRGYRLYADLIIEGLRAWPRTSKVRAHALPEPLSPANWENARLVPLREVALSDGWAPIADDRLRARWEPRHPGIMEATRPGESIRFKLRGTDFGLYDVVGPDSGSWEVTIDGRTLAEPLARWDRHCLRSTRSAHVMIGNGLTPGVHQVELTISADRHEDSQGTTMRVSDIILNGEQVR